MIKRLLTIALLLLPIMAMAQQKIAIVKVQTILAALPEKTDAQKQLTELSDKFKKEYQAMQAEFNAKYAQYQTIANDDATPQTIKERRMQEIQELDKYIQQFIANTDKEVQAKRSELEKPLYDRVHALIAQVCATKGITYAIDASSGQLIYAGPDAIDITTDVLNLLHP